MKDNGCFLHHFSSSCSSATGSLINWSLCRVLASWLLVAQLQLVRQLLVGVSITSAMGLAYAD